MASYNSQQITRMTIVRPIFHSFFNLGRHQISASGPTAQNAITINIVPKYHGNFSSGERDDGLVPLFN
jgi:hypothetical protein